MAYTGSRTTPAVPYWFQLLPALLDKQSCLIFSGKWYKPDCKHRLWINCRLHYSFRWHCCKWVEEHNWYHTTDTLRRYRRANTCIWHIGSLPWCEVVSYPCFITRLPTFHLVTSMRLHQSHWWVLMWSVSWLEWKQDTRYVRVSLISCDYSSPNQCLKRSIVDPQLATCIHRRTGRILNL